MLKLWKYILQFSIAYCFRLLVFENRKIRRWIGKFGSKGNGRRMLRSKFPNNYQRIPYEWIIVNGNLWFIWIGFVLLLRSKLMINRCIFVYIYRIHIYVLPKLSNLLIFWPEFVFLLLLQFSLEWSKQMKNSNKIHKNRSNLKSIQSLFIHLISKWKKIGTKKNTPIYELNKNIYR